MDENKKLVVVPWDFTPVAENALAHAVRIGRQVNNEVALLHIVDSGIKPKEEGEKKVLLQRVADNAHNKYKNYFQTCGVHPAIKVIIIYG